MAVWWLSLFEYRCLERLDIAIRVFFRQCPVECDPYASSVYPRPGYLIIVSVLIDVIISTCLNTINGSLSTFKILFFIVIYVYTKRDHRRVIEAFFSVESMG